MDKNTLTRRQAIGAGAAGAALVGGGAALLTDGPEEALAAGSCVLAPSLTQGPYWVDENLNRSDVRSNSDGTTTQSGAKLTLTMTVFDYDGDCALVNGAKVDIWHCNAAGNYSDINSQQNGGNFSGQNWLRGYQTTGSDGKVTLTTIFPGFYVGRAAHIHLRVRIGTTNYTSQIFFTEAQTAATYQTSPYSGYNNRTRTTNSQDDIYKQGGSNTLLVTLGGDAASGYTADLSLGVPADTSGSSATATPTATATGTATATASPTDSSVDASIVEITVRRRRHRVRKVRLEIKASERVGVVAVLRRDGRSLAKKATAEFGAGTSVLNLQVAKSARQGPARLRLELLDTKGNTKTLSRAVHLPKART